MRPEEKRDERGETGEEAEKGRAEGTKKRKGKAGRKREKREVEWKGEEEGGSEVKRRATRQRGRPVKDGVRENASFLSRLQAAKEGGTPEEGETRTKGERVRDRTGGEGEEGRSDGGRGRGEG